jgi:diguanylate cyclase
MSSITLALPPEGQRRKRSVYAALLWLALLGTAIALARHLLAGPAELAAVALSSASTLLFGAAAVMATVRRVPLPVIEHLVLWGVATLLLGNLGLRLYGIEAGPETASAIMTSLLWMPLLFVFSTIAFDGETSLRYSAALFVLIVLVTLPHALTTLAGPLLTDGLGVMLQAYLAYAVMIVALYFFADLQQRVVAMEETARTMRKLANTDALTGLANRRQAEELLVGELRRAERYGRTFSLLMLDIDGFKELNDRFGHQAGDDVLVDLARRLATMVRASDTVARWGGEEFLLLAPETRLEDAQRLAEMIRRHVNDNRLAERYQITISLGVASYRPGDTAGSLVARSDAALYLAKRGGRNQVRLEILPTPAPA